MKIFYPMNLKLTTKIEDRWAPSASPRADGAHLSRFLHTVLQMVPICPLLFLISVFLLPVSAFASVRFQSSPSSKATSLTDGLVGHWTFDGEDLKNNVKDRSGNNNNGYMTGFTSTSTAVTRGKIGQGLRFDGSNDRIAISTNIIGSDNATICAWINTRSLSSWQAIVGDNSFIFGPYSDGNRLVLTNNGGSSVIYSANNSLTTNQWYHACAIRLSNGTGSIYINGVQSGSSGSIGASAFPLNTAIGSLQSGGGGYNFNGQLDDVRVYNRALSASEITQLYQTGQEKIGVTSDNKAGSLSSGLVGHWTFDGKDLARNVADRSGLGNTGYMKGFTSTSTAVTRGKIGQGLKFDGVNDYVNIPNNSSFKPAGAMTISGWFKGKGKSATGGGVGTLGSTGDRGYSLGIDSDQDVNLNIATSSTEVVSLAVSNLHNETIWNHYVAVFTPSVSLEIFKNGVSIGRNTTGIPASQYVDNGLALHIGERGNNDAWFIGLIDDVRIYNRALSPSEIQSLYQMGQEKLNITPSTKATSLTDGLVGHWTFDGKDLARNVRDRSGLGNTGYMKGFTSTSSAQVAGKLGQGLKFDGVDDCVNITSVSSFSANAPLTISVWFKPAFVNTAGSVEDIVFVPNQTYDAAGIGQFNSQLTFVIGTQGYSGCGLYSGLVANKWYLLTGTFNGTLQNFYINGTRVCNNVVATLNAFSSLKIGSNAISSTRVSTGSLDDVRIYNRALSPSEIKQLYLMGK